MADVRRGGKNPLMSVNSLRRRHLAMLTPAFPWHLVLSVCMFVGTCSFVGLSDKMRFFFSPHEEEQEGEDKRDFSLRVNERK